MKTNKKCHPSSRAPSAISGFKATSQSKTGRYKHAKNKRRADLKQFESWAKQSESSKEAGKESCKGSADELESLRVKSRKMKLVKSSATHSSSVKVVSSSSLKKTAKVRSEGRASARRKEKLFHRTSDNATEEEDSISVSPIFAPSPKPTRHSKTSVMPQKKLKIDVPLVASSHEKCGKGEYESAYKCTPVRSILKNPGASTKPEKTFQKLHGSLPSEYSASDRSLVRDQFASDSTKAVIEARSIANPVLSQEFSTLYRSIADSLQTLSVQSHHVAAGRTGGSGELTVAASSDKAKHVLRVPAESRMTKQRVRLSVRFSRYRTEATLPLSELETAKEARKGGWSAAPFEDHLWDGFKQEFRDQELTMVQMQELIRLRQLQYMVQPECHEVLQEITYLQSIVAQMRKVSDSSEKQLPSGENELLLEKLPVTDSDEDEVEKYLQELNLLDKDSECSHFQEPEAEPSSTEAERSSRNINSEMIEEQEASSKAHRVKRKRGRRDVRQIQTSIELSETVSLQEYEPRQKPSTKPTIAPVHCGGDVIPQQLSRKELSQDYKSILMPDWSSQDVACFILHKTKNSRMVDMLRKRNWGGKQLSTCSDKKLRSIGMRKASDRDLILMVRDEYTNKQTEKLKVTTKPTNQRVFGQS